jgi:PleD family two-component response regulator
MTTPCKLIDLGNGMIPALENRATPSLADNTKSFEILLAEDNTVNQRLAVKILEKYHHVVTVVGNGWEAVKAVQSKKFDVILMDVQMPIMVSINIVKLNPRSHRADRFTNASDCREASKPRARFENTNVA